MTVTNTGFITKRLNEIREEFKLRFLTLFPNANMSDETINGQINALFADAYSDIYELAQDVYNSNDITAAEGYNLDKLAAITGTVRQEETFGSTFLLVLTSGVTTIPAGYQAALTSNPNIIFQTVAPITTFGFNEADYLQITDTPDSGSFTLTTDGIYTTAPILYNATDIQIKTALNLVIPGAPVTSVSGTWASKSFYIVFSDAKYHLITTTSSLTKAGNPLSLFIYRYTIGGINGQTRATCLTTGRIEALAYTINTPVTINPLVVSVTNATDVIPGSDRETDEELRLKLVNIVGTAPSNTDTAIKRAVFKLNETETNSAYIINDVTIRHNRTDGIVGSLNPHSFETSVNYPGAIAPGFVDLYMDQKVGNAIYSALPAGIETQGTNTVSVDTGFGYDYIINFTRPVKVFIYAIITITRDVDTFPVDGVQLLKNAIVNYGDSLGVGKNVIVHGTDSLEKVISGVAGITDIAINIDTVNPPIAGDVNIVIDDGSNVQVEISIWQSQYITINLV